MSYSDSQDFAPGTRPPTFYVFQLRSQNEGVEEMFTLQDGLLEAEEPPRGRFSLQSAVEQYHFHR